MAKAKGIPTAMVVDGEVIDKSKMSLEYRMELFENRFRNWSAEQHKVLGLALGCEIAYAKHGIKPQLVVIDTSKDPRLNPEEKSDGSEIEEVEAEVVDESAVYATQEVGEEPVEIKE